ncbi:WD domain protein [Aspergillus terreus]|uniref:WD domain protein n=1 Tax=Aspergillus terreus TaxID=33178 RepID=A0A5M3YN29_ASPTE|nr:hypothetical protein ATETN484_0001103300 [Aspergillus terreus]GFF12888.1 WD domain protein [Aspergillus terreus]
MPGPDLPNQQSKRSRKSDAIEEKKMPAKRRRTSGDGENLKKTSSDQHRLTKADGEENAVSPEPWSLSTSIAGRFRNIDPLLSPGDEYIFVGVDSGVNVYSAATSRLFRSLKWGKNRKVVGYNLHPTIQEHLYIFTSDGTVREWDWTAATQVAHWEIGNNTVSAQFCSHEREAGGTPAVLSLRRRPDGMKEVLITHLEGKRPDSTVILETKLPVEHAGGRGQHAARPRETIDIVLGEPNGSMLIYYDALNVFAAENGTEGKKNLSPRRLHWHRDPVSAVRWSRDGNYVISGGLETVMVLWQLDTGRKQFLPHLSAQICNIVVSETGSAYLVKLADNSLVLLSARELQPFATITGLQLCPKTPNAKIHASKARPSAAPPAVLHPQYPDHLLVPVPVRQQLSPEGLSSADFCVLQTYDIRTDSHVSRQALARTNATTLNVGPEGSRIDTPDVALLDVAHDGKWMATVDTWSPHQQDISVLDLSTGGSDQYAAEVFLKFWKWSNATKAWELVARIDGPHFTKLGPASVLDLASRPHTHEFATVGSDAVLRLWCPTTRQRSGLKQEHYTEPLESWKCRNTIDLGGYIGTEGSSVSTASLTYSEDGSALALCLETVASGNLGLAIIIDVQNCTIRRSRAGVYPGRLCGTKFLGSQLVIASQNSVSIWDTVGDLVRTSAFGAEDTASVNRPQLLAVDSGTKTFAVASQYSHSRSSKSQFQVRVYDIDSLSQLFQHKLSQPPLALLSSPHSGDYVVVDAGANVLRLGCQQRVSHITQPQELASRLDSGLTSLFGGQSGADWHKNSLAPVSTSAVDTSASGQLASVFREAPFVAPPTSILFRDVVKVLSG